MATAAKRAAKPRQKQQVDEVEPDDGELEQGTEFTPEDVVIAGLLAELGDTDVSVRIYREGPQGYRDLTFIDEVSVQEFSPKMLKGDPYNGGTFRIHAQGPEGGLRVNRRLKVEPGPKQPVVQQLQQQSGLAGMSPEQFAVMMANIMKGVMPAPVDPMGQMKDVVSVLAPLLNKPATPAPVVPQQTMTEKLMEWKMLKELFADGGGGGETSMIEKVAMKGMDFFATAAQQRALQQPAPQQAAIAPPVQTVQEVPQLTEEQEEELIMARMALRAACAAAAAKEQANEFAEDNYNLIPQGLLVTVACAPDWFEQLKAFFPGVEPHRDWFELVRLKLVEIGVEEDLLTKHPDGSITPNLKGELTQDATIGAAGSPSVNDASGAGAGSGGKPA